MRTYRPPGTSLNSLALGKPALAKARREPSGGEDATVESDKAPSCISLLQRAAGAALPLQPEPAGWDTVSKLP